MNKENTVVLDLDRYNELRDFEKNINDNKFAVKYVNYFGESHYEYMSKQEINTNVIQILNDSKIFLTNQIDKLKQELKKEQGKRRYFWNKKEEK